jgi:tetratricopeptide (TPR) repeat protein
VLTPEEVSAAAKLFLGTPPDDRSQDLIDGALGNADVVFAIGGLLRDRRESDPSSVAVEAESIYKRLVEHTNDVGLFDERDYLLGDFAYLAGGAHRFLGNRELAFRWLDRAEAAFRHTVNPGPGLANVAYTRLALRHEMGRFDDVLELLPSLVSSFEKLGMYPEIMKARFLEGETLKRCNRIPEAYALVSEARERFKERIEPGLDGQVLMWLGDCEVLQDRSEDALRTYQQAVPLLERSNRKISLAHLHANLGEMFRRENQLVAALDSYRAAQEEYSVLGMGTWVAYLRILTAETLIAMSRPREAEWEILQALPTIEEQKMVPEGFAAVALLRESVKRRKADPNALRELREHLQKQN